MIAARDVGRVAALRLSDPNWKGMYIRELHGPADMSFDEAAEMISQVLGRKILFIRSDKQEARHALLNTGMSENLADSLLEMYDAVEMGRLQPLQPRSLESTTPTTFTEFVHEVMLPLIAQPVTH
jgi:hypothetical protein